MAPGVANYKREAVDDNSTASQNEGGTKKLRSVEPDLKVIVGSDEDKGIRWCYSATLAARSKYVDTMLATPMKEQESRTLTFPDIDPSTWDDMIKFLDDPIASRRMNVNDVLKLAPLYDKYDFCDGRRLCDVILVQYFKLVKTRETKQAPDVTAIVNCIVMANDAHLEGAYCEGMKYIIIKLNTTSIPYGRTMFEEEHLKKLHPFLKGIKEGDALYRNLTSSYHLVDSVQSPNFPSQFVLECKNWINNQTLQNFINRIELSGTGCKADGYFLRECFSEYSTIDDRRVRWGGVEHVFKIYLHNEGWSIVRETLPSVIPPENEDEEEEVDYDSIVETVCWVAPCSGNLPLPPETGWKSVDPLATGNPKISYILNKSGSMGHYNNK